MKSTAWLRVVVVLLVLLGLAAALLRWAVPLPDDDWRTGLALNLVTELAGAALTYVLFELFIGLMKERETKKEELEARKADLIAQMGSSVKDVAIAATEELDRRGWLTDGSLRRAWLPAANLQEATLIGADLQRAKLVEANLQRAMLAAANLQGAFLWGANLQGTYLGEANLQGAYLAAANLQRANLQGDTWARPTCVGHT
jgi:hypothetical protein